MKFPYHAALWSAVEFNLSSTSYYANPLTECVLDATFTSPSGTSHRAEGFWDGGRDWKVRFMPGEPGAWRYETRPSNGQDKGLTTSGEFEVSEVASENPFRRHGAIRVSGDRRHLVHADGTPFFWLGDTAWNGPLRSAPDEWSTYLAARRAQRFNVVQWVATHWRSAPNGDTDGRIAYTGCDSILVNPQFFKRLDGKIIEMNRYGFLSAAVMLWAHKGRAYPESNPGYVLPVDQAVLLGRYMVARWEAYHVAWILAGDGDYSGDGVTRWNAIGAGVFGDRPHAPVAMHFQGKKLPLDDFGGSAWLDIMAYQSGHYDDAESYRWVFGGPVAAQWPARHGKVLLNSEPCYEDHMGRSGKRFDAHAVRRVCYWSAMAAPFPGITYGGHGIWGWDNGRDPAVDHPQTGTPLHWNQALELEAGTQMRHLRAAFESTRWWELRPAPGLVVRQPAEAESHVSAAALEDGSAALVYTPVAQPLAVDLTRLKPGLPAAWIDVRNGARRTVGVNTQGGTQDFTPPGPGDWLLMFGA